jgi:DNA-binding HxlR family transcriptional regulator
MGLTMSDQFDYGEACPVSMAASVLAERWTLQIIREMFLGSTKYSQFQTCMPKISPTLLKNRLRALEKHGIITREKKSSQRHPEYFLTPSGKALGPVLTEFGKWGMRFARSGMTDKANTVYGLMRDFSGALDIDELPSRDFTLQLILTDHPESAKQYINVHNGKPQFCSQNLGFEIDVYITSTLKDMTKIWYGELTISAAIKDKKMVVVGNSQYTRNIAKWLRISGFTGDNPQFVAPERVADLT